MTILSFIDKHVVVSILLAIVIYNTLALVCNTVLKLAGKDQVKRERAPRKVDVSEVSEPKIRLVK